MKITKSRLREIIKQELSELTGTAATAGGTGLKDAEKEVSVAQRKIDTHKREEPSKIKKTDQTQSFTAYTTALSGPTRSVQYSTG